MTKKAPARWGWFAHILPYRLGNSFAGLLLAVLRGYPAVDIDVQVCWADETRTRRVLIAAHWDTVGKNGMYDPLGLIPQTAKLSDLTWAEVSRLRGKKPYRTRIRRITAVLKKAHRLGLRVELEAKQHKYLQLPIAWRNVLAYTDQLWGSKKKSSQMVQVKTLSDVGPPNSPHGRLSAVKTASPHTPTILLTREPVASDGIPRRWAPVIDYVRGRFKWAE